MFLIGRYKLVVNIVQVEKLYYRGKYFQYLPRSLNYGKTSKEQPGSVELASKYTAHKKKHVSNS